MDIYLNEEMRAFRALIREFVEREVMPREQAIEENDEIPAELLAKAKEIGLFGLGIPEEYGGTDLGTLGTTICFEELGRSSHGFALTISGPTGIGLTGLLTLGTQEQKQRYLPRMATGEMRSCFALTEPGAGSDASAISTRAVRKGGKWVLNGQKCFITGAPYCDLFTVFAVTDPSKGAKGISAFLVERSFPGLRVGRPEKKMGLRGCHTSELFFDDCEVPAENLLGAEGTGYSSALKTLSKGRITLAARSCGAMDRIISESVKYAKERQAFGQPIANFQLIQAHLADMAVDYLSSRTLTYHAANMHHNGQSCIAESSMAKLHATEAFGRVADKGVQIHGGMGYMREVAVERFYRDARITRIFEGTSEIQRLVIAGQLLKG